MASLGGDSTVCGPTLTPAEANACLIDDVLAQAITTDKAKSGYYFLYVPDADPATSYKLNAEAQSASVGVKHFYTDESSVIRVSLTAKAAVTDPSI
jgi:hypothetical protein